MCPPQGLEAGHAENRGILVTLAIFSEKPARGLGRTSLRRSAPTRRSAFTLVEMLIAISITLVMMATVVGVFATLSESVSKRRAAIEVGGQLRHVRNTLQRDLAGATCPVIPWQKAESDTGYFEIVEGLHADFYPSDLTDGSGNLTDPNNPEIDHAASTLPASNLNFATGANVNWVTDGGGLGDYDDMLAFTSRNEKEPFTGPAPSNNFDPSNSNAQRSFNVWRSQTISSPVAEVIWFAVENPADAYDPTNFFNEPGFRTIYRRTLLVVPWLDYNYGGKSRPGVLRIMSGLTDENNDVARALAALVAFQERYDISARIEYDRALGAWTIKANTLADLVDRKNRFEHHGYNPLASVAARQFPYVFKSSGGGSGNNSVRFTMDPAYNDPGSAAATAVPNTTSIAAYTIGGGEDYPIRPFAAIEGGGSARAMLNEQGRLAYVTTGLVPLGITGPNSSRAGQDLMMSQALAFDVQVYDPEAPLFAVKADGSVVTTNDVNNNNVGANADLTPITPADAGWRAGPASSNAAVLRQGAYVDLGYAFLHREYSRLLGGSSSVPAVITPFSRLAQPKSLTQDGRLTRVYDTWNFGYENDGVNQDLVEEQSTPGATVLVDEGTNGFDDNAVYPDGSFAQLLGPDDPAERETSPPYPTPLRAVQVKLRVYEPDSRQMREVTVRQHFVPE